MVTARSSPHSTRKRPPWQGGGAAALLLLALTLVFFWPQVGEGRALYWGDIGLYFTPMTEFLHDNLRRGRLPLWNPLILCGAPYLGNPQVWPLYPLTALLPFVSAPYFLSLTIAFHVWLAGLGTFLFLRRALGVRPGAALLGAVTFMFSGWLVSKEQFPNMVQASSYLPWTLWGVEGILRQNGVSNPPAGGELSGRSALRPETRFWERVVPRVEPGEATSGARGFPAESRLRAALALGLIVGLQLLAAHAQMTLLTLSLAAAWGLFLLARTWGRWRPPALAAHLALAAALAVGLSAGQVLPDMQLFHDGWRQDLSFRIVNRFYLPLNQTANWILPTLHGDPFDGNFTARGNFWETCCYVGWVPFVLAVFGAWRAVRRGGDPTARFWVAAFVVAYFMALGGGADSRPGPYWLAYQFLPGFRAFHDPARCLSWATFALAVLAAWGLEALTGQARRSVRGRVAALALLLAFADLTHFGRTIYPLADPSALFPVTRTLAALRADPQIAAHQARFLAPDSARVWQRFSPHQSYREGVPNYPALWADTLTPNLPMDYGLPDAYGYEPVTRRDAQAVLGGMASAFRPNAPAAERARAAAGAGFVGVRFVATDRVRPPEATLRGLVPLFSDPSLPPLKPGDAPSRVCLSRDALWQPRARLVMGLGADAATLRAAHFVSDTPDRVALAADAPRPAYLLLADTLQPGWRATVDGGPVPLLRTHGFLRAVRLRAPGPHTVVFTYRPVTFLLGLYLTLLTSATLLGALVFTATAQGRSVPNLP